MAVPPPPPLPSNQTHWFGPPPRKRRPAAVLPQHLDAAPGSTHPNRTWHTVRRQRPVPAPGHAEPASACHCDPVAPSRFESGRDADESGSPWRDTQKRALSCLNAACGRATVAWRPRQASCFGQLSPDQTFGQPLLNQRAFHLIASCRLCPCLFSCL